MAWHFEPSTVFLLKPSRKTAKVETNVRPPITFWRDLDRNKPKWLKLRVWGAQSVKCRVWKRKNIVSVYFVKKMWLICPLNIDQIINSCPSEHIPLLTPNTYMKALLKWTIQIFPIYFPKGCRDVYPLSCLSFSLNCRRNMSQFTTGLF